MSGKVVGWAFDEGEARGLELSRRFVLVAYADNADRDGRCFPSKKEIIGKTGASRATWYRAKDELVAAGLITFTEDERGREYVQLAVPWASHDETDLSHDEIRPPDALSQRETASSHDETRPSHGETGTNKGTVSEPSTNQTAEVSAPDVVAEIYEFWKRTTGRNGSTKLTPNRRAAVKARLAEGRDPAYIKRAIANVAADEFHQGKNDRGRRFDDLTLICRNGEKLEGYFELGGGAAASAPPSDGPIVESDRAREAWDDAKERIRGVVPDGRFRTHFAPLEVVGERDGKLVLLDSSGHGGGQWVMKKMRPLVLEVVEGFDDVELVDETQLELEAA